MLRKEIPIHLITSIQKKIYGKYYELMQVMEF
jgi:hypothetical protein